MANRRLGIRARLFGAFGIVAAMTIAATAVAWLSFGSLGDRLNRIVAVDLPTVTLAARLAETGSAITATAPILAAATTEKERSRSWSRLTKNLNDMRSLLKPTENLGGAQENGEVRSLIELLVASSRRLDANVRRRLRFRELNRALVDRLRWAHADFLQEVEPMIDDARFKIGLAIGSQGTTRGLARGGDAKHVLRLELTRQAALFRINAAGNLAVGLLARAASLSALEDLKDTSLFLSEIQGHLESDLKLVSGLPEALSLRQSLQDLMAFSKGRNDLFALRRDELKTLAAGRDLVEANRRLVNKLQRLINERVVAGNRTSLTSAKASTALIGQGKAWLLAVAGASIVVAILVVWLYVGRNLVHRIRLLDRAMRDIAGGNLRTPVPTGGSDEISEMATALGTFRDTLVETQAELVQAGKLAALGQLSAGVAHELNQPLAAMRNYTHNSRLLIARGDTATANENLIRIADLIERMGATVSHLRTLARRPSGQLENVDLEHAIHRALSLHDNRLTRQHIRIDMDIAAGQCFVRAEAIRLEQVLINLFGNAVDAMAGKDGARLVIKAERTRNQIVLLVADNGCGIAQENLQRVFDPFFTTKDVGEGLGLGLAISYNIVKDFGGSLRVSSTAGEGAVFRVALKRAVSDAQKEVGANGSMWADHLHRR